MSNETDEALATLLAAQHAGLDGSLKGGGGGYLIHSQQLHSRQRQHNNTATVTPQQPYYPPSPQAYHQTAPLFVELLDDTEPVESTVDNLARFDLREENGIINRRRELVTHELRKRILGLECAKCKTEGCKKKLYYRPDLVKSKQKLCIGCSKCIDCGKKPGACSCTVKGNVFKPVKIKKVKWCKWFMRVLFMYCVLFGLLTYVYHLFIDNVLYSVLMSILITYSVQESNHMSVTVNGTVIPRFNLDIEDTMIAGLWVIAMVLLMLTMIKSVPFTINALYPTVMAKTREMINKRTRYEELERERLAINPTERDTTFDYYSDDDRVGMEDPETAIMNLTQEDSPASDGCCCSCSCRRMKRRLCLS
jgi:hypothetical protein